MRLYVRCSKIKSGGMRALECCLRDQNDPKKKCPKKCENREEKK